MSEQFKATLNKLADAFIQHMPFTKGFNLQVESFTEKKIVLKFDMNPSLQGNLLQGILHGGATATALDSAGGMVAIAARCATAPELSTKEQLARIAYAATVDFRVDYLRPGRGEHFFVEAEILRAGNKIISVRSHFYDHEKTLLAAGSGTYVVGK